jgi:hypothetical protein
VDGLRVELSGPQTRTLFADGHGWFGAVDLPPGDYLLTVDVISPTATLESPLTVTAGAVIRKDLVLPSCQPLQTVYLPLIVKNR